MQALQEKDPNCDSAAMRLARFSGANKEDAINCAASFDPFHFVSSELPPTTGSNCGESGSFLVFCVQLTSPPSSSLFLGIRWPRSGSHQKSKPQLEWRQRRKKIRHQVQMMRRNSLWRRVLRQREGFLSSWLAAKAVMEVSTRRKTTALGNLSRLSEYETCSPTQLHQRESCEKSAYCGYCTIVMWSPFEGF